MKFNQKVLGSFVLVGALGISGAAFADININVDFGTKKYEPVAKVQTKKQRPEMPKDFDGKKPPMISRDMKGNPPEPPDGKRPPMSGDKKFDGKKMPPRPNSDDRRPDRKPDKKPDKKY